MLYHETARPFAADGDAAEPLEPELRLADAILTQAVIDWRRVKAGIDCAVNLLRNTTMAHLTMLR